MERTQKIDRIFDVYYEWADVILAEHYCNYFSDRYDLTLQWAPDFGCYPRDPEDLVIDIGIFCREDDPTNLRNHLRLTFEHLYPDQYEIYTLCFLHEVGHLITFPGLSQQEQDREISGLSFEKYRAAVKEHVADQWMADYIVSNRATTRIYQDLLKEAYAKVTEQDLCDYFAQ